MMLLLSLVLGTLASVQGGTSAGRSLRQASLAQQGAAAEVPASLDPNTKYEWTLRVDYALNDTRSCADFWAASQNSQYSGPAAAYRGAVTSILQSVIDDDPAVANPVQLKQVSVRCDDPPGYSPAAGWASLPAYSSGGGWAGLPQAYGSSPSFPQFGAVLPAYAGSANPQAGSPRLKRLTLTATFAPTFPSDGLAIINGYSEEEGSCALSEQVQARGAGAWAPSYFEYYSDSLASICVVGFKGCSEGQWDPSVTYPLALTCFPSSG